MTKTNGANPYSKDAMRERLAVVTAKEAAIRAKSDPLREKRDAMVRAHRAAEEAANAEIAKVEAELFDIVQEKSVLTRAIGGGHVLEAAPPTVNAR